MSDAGHRRLLAGSGLIALVALSWFIGSLTGLVAGLIGAVVLICAGPRWVGSAAVAALVVAAFAAIAEHPLTRGYETSYANQRPIAAHAALVAGVLLLSALAGFCWRERAPLPCTSPTESNRNSGEDI
jgi:hypothetical protein